MIEWFHQQLSSHLESDAKNTQLKGEQRDTWQVSLTAVITPSRSSFLKLSTQPLVTLRVFAIRLGGS